MQNDLTKARLISRALENSGYFSVLSNIHKPKPTGAMDALNSAAKQVVAGHMPYNEEDAEFYMEGLPVVTFRFTDEIKRKFPNVQQAWVQKQLRGIGWIVPKSVSCITRSSRGQGIVLTYLATHFLQHARTQRSSGSLFENHSLVTSLASSLAISFKCKSDTRV